MAITYRTIYQGSFCNTKGGNVNVRFNLRMDTTDPPVIPTDIMFAGENDEPVCIEYEENGNDKGIPLTQSNCIINLKAIENFELSNLYTQDDKEWQVIISGAWNWSGFLIPDSCIEPYESQPYDVSVRATDCVKTLEDVPFQLNDRSKIRGLFSDFEVLRIALARTTLRLKMVCGVNTYEEQMSAGISPLKQSWISANRFIDDQQNAFSCYEVIRSILERYSCRLMQIDGKWHIINTLEYSRGDVFAYEFDDIGNLTGTIPNLINPLTVGDSTRTIRPVNANKSLPKAYSLSTAYYEYGYVSNELINGDMNAWPTKPAGLPDNWVKFGATGTAIGATRQFNGVDTTDHYIVIDDSSNDNISGIRNIEPVQVRANEVTKVSFDMYSPGSLSGSSNRYNYISLIIQDDAGKYYTNTGWQSSYGYYTIKKKKGESLNQWSLSFDVNPQPEDYKLTLSFLPVSDLEPGDRYSTNINNVSVRSGTDAAVKPAVGSFNRQSLLTDQTFKPDPILLLHGDDSNDQRTSPIYINGDTEVFSSKWKRAGITEEHSIFHIVANTQLRMHQRPYIIFEGEFKGSGTITPLSLLTIDLIEGQYMFMSGKFNLKTDVHTLRFAQTFINEPSYIEEQVEDNGTSSQSPSVGSPGGVTAPGSSYTDSALYVPAGDLPVKASNLETQAGTDDEKFITSLKLANWFSYVKGIAQTISGVWNFSTRPTYAGNNLLVTADLAGYANNYRPVTSAYSIVSTDYTIDATSGSFTLTLPNAFGLAGKIYIIKKTGAGVINLAGVSGQQIDGASPISVTNCVIIQSTGAGWIKISEL